MKAARAVAAYHRVELGQVRPLLVGYGQVAPPKWAAWRRKEGLEEVCPASLYEEVSAVAALVEPVFTAGA